MGVKEFHGLLAQPWSLPYVGHMREASTGSRVPTWTLGDRLRKARLHAGLDQGELAETIGIKRSTVGNYERGDTIPKRPVLLSWALATGVEQAWLETGRGAGDPSTSPDGRPSQAATGQYADLAYGRVSEPLRSATSWAERNELAWAS